MRLLFPPFSLPKLYNSAGSRYNHIFSVNGAALAASWHSTFSLSIGNFYLEDLRRSKSTLGYFEQLASFASLAFRLLNPLSKKHKRQEAK
jgi:hypothetical protein